MQKRKTPAERAEIFRFCSLSRQIYGDLVAAAVIFESSHNASDTAVVSQFTY